MIHLTESARAHLVRLVMDHPGAIGVSLKVVPSGCSGQRYVLSMVEQPLGEEHWFLPLDAGQPCRFWVEQSAFPWVSGLTMDCQEDGLNTQIRFMNPNATYTCGCGESFTGKKGKDAEPNTTSAVTDFSSS